MTGAVPVTVLALVHIHSIIIVQAYVVFIINDLMYPRLVKVHNPHQSRNS